MFFPEERKSGAVQSGLDHDPANHKGYERRKGDAVTQEAGMVEGFHSGNGVVGGGISCHQVSSQAGISKESSEDSAEKAQKNRQHRIVEHKLLPGDTQGIESADHGTFLVDGVNDKDRDDIGDQDQDD